MTRQIARLVVGALVVALGLASHAAPVSYLQIGFIGAPASPSQMLYSSTYGKLVLRIGGASIRVLNLADGSTQTFSSTRQFTDMSLSSDDRYVFVADFGGDNGLGSGTFASSVGRLDLSTGTFQSKDAGGVIAYHIEAVDDDHFIVTSQNQWIVLNYASWGTGTSITVLTPSGSFHGYYADLFYGDIEYDSSRGRLIHGNSDLSSQEIQAFTISGNTFAQQEGSGGYGSAQGYGGTVVLAVDHSALYYGKLQVDPANVAHNLNAFPELIYAANGRAAFGNGDYYDPNSTSPLGSLGFGTNVYAPNHSGDDFWAYDAGTSMLKHFFASDGPLPAGPEANPDLVRTGPTVGLDVDVLANDLGFADPVTVGIATPPGHGTASVTGSPGSKAGIRIHYTPSPGFSGTDTFVYTVDDGTNSGSATVSIVVDSFLAKPDTFYVAHGASPSLYVARNDIGFKDPVTLTITTQPSHAYAYVYSGSGAAQDVYVTYSQNYSSTPVPDYTDTFTYQITDGVHTDSATVTVQVVSLKAVDDSALTNAGTPVTLNVTANDVYSSNITVGLFQTAAHGVVTPGYSGYPYYNPNAFVYTPEAGFVGTDSFVYAITDDSHVSYGTVTVTVIHDQDGDGVPDEIDNCILVPNPDQRDTDGDGYGNVCDADLNNDGIVNYKDLALFRQRFGTTDPDADLDGNGFVNFTDLAKFRQLFFKKPGPSGLHPQP